MANRCQSIPVVVPGDVPDPRVSVVCFQRKRFLECKSIAYTRASVLPGCCDSLAVGTPFDLHRLAFVSTNVGDAGAFDIHFNESYSIVDRTRKDRLVIEKSKRPYLSRMYSHHPIDRRG